jgi:hypothetical protein
MERSFAFFKQLLLRHSVQRPPYSVGLFSFQELKAITEWMMDSYYRHYKLYQVGRPLTPSARPQNIVTRTGEVGPTRAVMVGDQRRDGVGASSPWLCSTRGGSRGWPPRRTDATYGWWVCPEARVCLRCK